MRKLRPRIARPRHNKNQNRQDQRNQPQPRGHQRNPRRRRRPLLARWRVINRLERELIERHTCHYAIIMPPMSLLLRLLVLMDLLGPNGLNPPPPSSPPPASSDKYTVQGSGGTLGLSASNISPATGSSKRHTSFAESLEWGVADSDAVVRAPWESETQ